MKMIKANEVCNKSAAPWCIALLWLLASCGLQHPERAEEKKYVLRTVLTATYVGEDYVFSQNDVIGEDNCFVRFQGRKFLKKSQQFCDSLGNIIAVNEYHAEGLVNYARAVLLADKVLMKTNGWKAGNNLLKLQGNAVLFPVKGMLARRELAEKKYYILSKRGDHDELTVYETW